MAWEASLAGGDMDAGMHAEAVHNSDEPDMAVVRLSVLCNKPEHDFRRDQ